MYKPHSENVVCKSSTINPNNERVEIGLTQLQSLVSDQDTVTDNLSNCVIRIRKVLQDLTGEYYDEVATENPILSGLFGRMATAEHQQQDLTGQLYRLVLRLEAL